MSRLTKKETNTLSSYGYRTCEYLLNGTPRVKALNKLGKLEDLMEQYSINDLAELKIALDYYEQTKKVEKLIVENDVDTFKEIKDLLSKADIYDDLSNELGCLPKELFNVLKNGIDLDGVNVKPKLFYDYIKQQWCFKIYYSPTASGCYPVKNILEGLE